MGIFRTGLPKIGACRQASTSLGQKFG